MNQLGLSAVPRPRSAPPPNGDATRAEAPPSAECVAQARELDANLLAFAREVMTHDDAASEMPLRQFRVCVELVAGARSMSALSRELGVTLSAMTQIANRLERAGLVTRGFEDNDRRVRQLSLTPRARRMLHVRQESRIRRVASVLERMSPASRAETLAALSALSRAATQSPETAEPIAQPSASSSEYEINPLDETRTPGPSY